MKFHSWFETFRCQRASVFNGRVNPASSRLAFRRKKLRRAGAVLSGSFATALCSARVFASSATRTGISDRRGRSCHSCSRSPRALRFTSASQRSPARMSRVTCSGCRFAMLCCSPGSSLGQVEPHRNWIEATADHNHIDEFVTVDPTVVTPCYRPGHTVCRPASVRLLRGGDLTRLVFESGR